MKQQDSAFFEQVKEAEKLLQVIAKQVKELEEIRDREVNISNISRSIYLCDMLSKNSKNLDVLTVYVQKLINSYLYSHLPFALSQLGLSKLETQVDVSEGNSYVYSLAVKSDISVKRIADDDQIDQKLKSLGYEISKPFIHAARLKSVVKDAMEQGINLSDIVEIEKKYFVSFKEANRA